MAQAEEQLILRVPPRISEAVRRFSRGDKDTDVSLEPLDSKGNFLMSVGSETFAAKLVDLPTLIESHKTGDHKSFYKSSNISRMLFVYEKLAAASVDPRQDELSELLPMVPDPALGSKAVVCDSGITPPTQHIVRRRFKRAQRYIGKYPREEVAEAERVLLDLMVRDSYEHVVEELVDAESFMAPWFANGGDNVTIVYEDGVVTEMYQMQPSSSAATEGVRKPGARRKHPPPMVVHPNADSTFGTASAASAATAAAGGGMGAPSAGVASAGASRAASTAAALHAASSSVFPDSSSASPPGEAAAGDLPGIDIVDSSAGMLMDGGAGGYGFGEFSGLEFLPMDVFGDEEMLGGMELLAPEDQQQHWQPPPLQPPDAGYGGEGVVSVGGQQQGGFLSVEASDSGAAASMRDGIGGSPAPGSASAQEAALPAAPEAAAVMDMDDHSLAASHPEGAKLVAEASTVAAKLEGLRTSQEAKRQQAERATIRTLKERWEKDVRDLEGRIAAEQAALDAANAAVSRFAQRQRA